MTITYRTLHTTADLWRVFKLEKTIWARGVDDAVSPQIMAAILHNGGVVVGAEDGDRLIGFAFGVPGFQGGSVWLWSHTTGVLPEYQRQGIGAGLKFKQREWALDYGYTLIGWSFDPLQRRNASFNFRKLGVIVTSYAENLYGAMEDDFNRGMQSDRFKAAWVLDSPRVKAATEGKWLPPITDDFPDSAFLLRRRGDDLHVAGNLPESPLLFVEIPYDLAALKADDLSRAQHWQMMVRGAMQQALKAQYAVVDVVTQGERCWYVLQHQDDFTAYFG